MKSFVDFKKEIEEKISKHELTIGVIGLGYVGLPIAVEYAQKGFLTYGFDIDDLKINKLNKGENYIEDIDDRKVEEVTKSNKLIATKDFSNLQKCDAIFICVPTPFTVNKDPDISYIIDATLKIYENLRVGQMIILKSTTFPGTTEKFVLPILQGGKYKVSQDFYLSFSPERIDPGNKIWNTTNTPIVLGGISQEDTEICALVHSIIVEKVIPVSRPAVAEMEKLLENIFRSVNIALVNELAQLCDRIGINIWEVIYSASTKPFGFMPFYPGPGIGGHCILIDPYYLAWMAKEYDFVTKFIQLAAEINEDMPYYVKNMVIREIAKMGVPMAKTKVLFLGMAFKKDVSDLRHSPALKVAELLLKEGVKQVDYYDPYIPQISINGKVIFSQKELTANTLKSFDIVVITTDHSIFDYKLIAENSRIVIDTRNALKNIIDRRENIILLGEGK